MAHDLLFPEDIDRKLKWPAGHAMKLAKAGKLPHIRLPDDSIRFDWEEIAALIRRVPVTPGTIRPSPTAGVSIVDPGNWTAC